MLCSWWLHRGPRLLFVAAISCYKALVQRLLSFLIPKLGTRTSNARGLFLHSLLLALPPNAAAMLALSPPALKAQESPGILGPQEPRTIIKGLRFLVPV